MDFASAPLQSLLYGNADAFQLNTYIEQLYEQFKTTTNEQDRFGTLQILFPFLQAHHDQLPTQQEKELYLKNILQPIILFTLGHDSMVSTESASLVAKAAAHYTLVSITSFHDNSNNKNKKMDQQQNKIDALEDTFDEPPTAESIENLKPEEGFGYTLLKTLIGHLVLLIDIEPDFVDLKPLVFMNDHTKKNDDGDGSHDLWLEIKNFVDKLEQKCQRRYKTRLSMLQVEEDDDDNDNDNGDDNSNHDHQLEKENNNNNNNNDDDDNESIASGISLNTMTTTSGKMTLSDFTAMELLDMEYSLDIITRFVQEILECYYDRQQQQHENSEIINDDGDDNQLLNSWIHLIMVFSIAMLSCTNRSVRLKFVNDILPTILHWQKKVYKDDVVFKDTCQMVWKRTLQIYGLPATNLMRTETYGLIAKYFDTYFGLDYNTDETPTVYLDLRYKNEFFAMLQSGLQSDDALARKYTSFILKRVIDYCNKYPQTIKKNDDDDDHQQQSWTKYFEWKSDMAEKYTNLWDDWFLLYEIMHENVLHLVQPVLSRFESLLSYEPHLDASWWILILHRGFNNETVVIQKEIWEYIFARENSDTLNKLGSQQNFFFGTFLKAIDNTALYSVPTQGTLVSPFGEHLKLFITKVVGAIKHQDVKKQFLQQMIHRLAHVINSHIMILYIMEGIAKCEPCMSWKKEELKSLRYLVDRHRHFNTPNRKTFIRKLGIICFQRFADPSQISFSDVAKTVSSLFTDYPITTTSQEYKSIKTWLKKKVAKEKDFGDIISNLKDRINTFIRDDLADDVPIGILRNQSNVLARSTLFLITNDDGSIKPENLEILYSECFEKLQNQSTPLWTFNRLLILFFSLWEIIEPCFESKLNLTLLMNGGDLSIYQNILKRVENQLMDDGSPIVTDEPLMEPLIVVLQRILSNTTNTDNLLRNQKLKDYQSCVIKSLFNNSKEKSVTKELSKFTNLCLLRLTCQLAVEWNISDLEITASDMKNIIDLSINRVPELVKVRQWGDTIANFIRYKWNCLECLVYFIKKKMKSKSVIEIFDPKQLYQIAVDQLECASDICADAIINCITAILSLSWEKQAELVMSSVDYTISVLKEYINSSKVFPVLMQALIHMVFQPNLLSEPTLNQDDGPLKKAVKTILEIGEWKPFIVGDTVEILHSFWSTYTPEAIDSMILHTKQIATFLTFGPARDREDQKIDLSTMIKLQRAEVLELANGTAEMTFNQNDYYVRVLMNDLMLRLDGTNPKHIEFAYGLMKELIDTNDKPELYIGVFTNTPIHRFKMRSWCTIILLSRFIKDEHVKKYLERIFQLMQKETNVSVRSYMEWTVVRFLLQHPDYVTILYEQLGKLKAKPSYIISVMTVTFCLGDKIDDKIAGSYFEKLFPLLTPWLIPNHFNIRLYAYCAWKRNWRACKQRGFNTKLEENPYVQAINTYMLQSPDCKKMFDKAKANYYMTHFDPMDDYNLEFIFRENLHIFDVAEDERIGSRAFMRVNSTVAPSCPFTSSNKQYQYKSCNPTEEINTNEQEQQDEENEEKEKVKSVDGSYQKKITPWEMMLQTDIDLTKTLLKEKRRRNDLIVVASLVDRIPNIAGLCRTCEIFNASQLVLNDILVKDDPSFATVSVSSEKWMPLIEVQIPEIPDYLKKKKEEGYTICGLEQTTNSVKLGEYDFPEKCVLLLGKEREGIPPDLLQLLDQTIEIPQYGILRSLNVHVSGAICMFEYTKQMKWRQQSLT